MLSKVLWSECLCPLHNPYVEIEAPAVMVFGGEAIGKWLGPEGRALINEISALTEEDPEGFPVLSHHERTQHKESHHEPESRPPDTDSASALTLDFWEINLQCLSHLE